IRYTESKYGKDHVAQIITFGTMAARAAIRDVGRVLDHPYLYCDRVAKLIPMGMTIDESIESVPELKEIYANDPEAIRLLDNAKRLEGVARHVSTHACGVVITKMPLEEYVPVQFASASDQTVITQYSLHPIEDLGLLKMDFLGLSNLTIIETAINIIEKTRGIIVDLSSFPLDDQKSFQLLQQGKTIGVFQLESSGMRRYLVSLKPNEIEDIIAMVSLYRPGPMELIPDYIAGKHGRKKTHYLHPKLKPILEKTYGVAVYQEQIIQMARDIAGFTPGEADILRKAVGKKIKKLLDEQRQKFIDGSIKNGIEENTAKKIFDFIEPFARYGFNRAHAACYAMIAYQTAYLKANYTPEFMAALMTSDHKANDRIALEIEECRQFGIEVLPPDINESFSTFTVVKEDEPQTAPKRIRFGLSAIKNVGEGVIEAIISERKSNGPYGSLEDFLGRVQNKDLNKKSLESLIKAGAIDSLGTRGELLFNLESLLAYSKFSEQEVIRRQTNLFGLLPMSQAPKLNLKEAEPISKSQRLTWERELLGLYLSEHPLSEYKDQLAKIAKPISDLDGHPRSQPVTIAGIVTQIQKILTRHGDAMLFVKLEDLTGSIEVLVFPKLYKKTSDLWQEERRVIIKGKVSDKDGLLKLLSDDARILNPEELLQNNNTSEIKRGNINNDDSDDALYCIITLPGTATPEGMEQIKSVLSSFPGKTRVKITLEGDQPRTTVTNYYVDDCPALHGHIKDLVNQM
ncbi:MAG: DNA polymerase III subunit alpha, partial [bacterium]